MFRLALVKGSGSLFGCLNTKETDGKGESLIPHYRRAAKEKHYKRNVRI